MTTPSHLRPGRFTSSADFNRSRNRCRQAGILTDIDRDFWMSADEAIAYGLASRKIVNVSELE